MNDRTPHRLEDRGASPRSLLLPVWLVALLKGHDAYRDRRLRRNYESVEQRRAMNAPRKCSLCGSEAREPTCSACGADR